MTAKLIAARIIGRFRLREKDVGTRVFWADDDVAVDHDPTYPVTGGSPKSANGSLPAQA